jgi:type VI secretion system protein ImpM
VDKVGRYFPLTLAALPLAGMPNPNDWTAWLDAVEVLGRLALDEDAPPERMTPPPPPASVTFTDNTSSAWWTEGGPRVAAARLTLPALPDAARFATMLGFLAPTDSAL